MYQHVPTYILRRLHGEPVDFIVESDHDYGKRAIGWGIIILSIFFAWIFLFPIFFSFPLVQFFLTGHTTITVNETSPNPSPDNVWGPIMLMLFPSLLSVIFMIPVAIAIVLGIIFIIKKGGWYAGTHKYLIEFHGKHVFYYPWDEFSTTIETKKYKGNRFDIILTHKNLTKDSIHKHGRLEQNKYGHVTIELKDHEIDLNHVLEKRGFHRTKIGLLKIHNGDYVLSKIRHHIEHFDRKILHDSLN